MARILVVTPDRDEREALEAWLSSQGYEVISTGDFFAARAELEVHPPDLVLTAIRLGTHNGLHLAIRARFGPTGVPTLIFGGADDVLQAEAARLQTPYLVSPLDRTALLATVRDTIDRHRPARRSPRKRIAKVDALVDDVQAALVELSYEGLRLKVAARAREPVPDYFLLRVPNFNVACRVRRIWVRKGDEGEESLWCGAALATDDASAAVAWRQFVDATPGWSVAVN